MVEKLYKVTLFAIFTILLLPSVVSAHQPRITESRLTQVTSPEISKAYYGKLTGEPDVYVMSSSEPFDLYVNVLVPDIADQKKDVSAVVIKDDNVAKPLAILDGVSFEWKKFYEPFGADTYWMGPEYRARAEAGKYEIRVQSSVNDSKYSLAIGEIEAFDTKEVLNTLTIIPRLKRDFFNVSPIGFIVSPFGWGLIVVMYVLAFVFGFIYRLILKSLAKKSLHIATISVTRSVTGGGAESVTETIVKSANKNIGKSDRLIRLLIGVALLLFAIFTTWNPIIIFFSGFAIFEAVFSWCAFYAAIGKNTCSVE